jgi:hypothetical protein
MTQAATRIVLKTAIRMNIRVYTNGICNAGYFWSVLVGQKGRYIRRD